MGVRTVNAAQLAEREALARDALSQHRRRGCGATQLALAHTIADLRLALRDVQRAALLAHAERTHDADSG